MFQSFNFRQRENIRPFYALIANIATKELGHIEMVGAAVNDLLNGAAPSLVGAADFQGRRPTWLYFVPTVIFHPHNLGQNP